ncbi:hypothetical protein J6590_105873 [Homalodisca vitripennis]|nr:hypothetical protein J6590_105873 [Homalodisca vitripennis]
MVLRYGRKRIFTAACLTYIISGPLAAFATSYCKIRAKEDLHCSVSYIHHIRATRSLCYFILQDTGERGSSLQRVLHTSYQGYSQPLLLHIARYGRKRIFTAACLTYIISGPLAAFATSYCKVRAKEELHCSVSYIHHIRATRSLCYFILQGTDERGASLQRVLHTSYQGHSQPLLLHTARYGRKRIFTAACLTYIISGPLAAFATSYCKIRAKEDLHCSVSYIHHIRATRSLCYFILQGTDERGASLQRVLHTSYQGHSQPLLLHIARYGRKRSFTAACLTYIISGPLAAFATSYCKVRTKEELHCSVSYIHHIRATRSLCYFILQGTDERGASLQRVLHTSYQGHSQPLLLHTARYGRKRIFTAACLTYIISGPLAAFATSYCKVRAKEELHCSVSYIHHIRATRSLCYFILQGDVRAKEELHCSVSYIHHIRATRSLCYFILQGTDERGASPCLIHHIRALAAFTSYCRYGRKRSFTAACLTYIISGPLAAFATSYCKVRTKEELHCSVSYIHHIRATRSLCYFILQGTDERGASLQRVLHTSYQGHSQPLLLHIARYGRKRSFTAACLTYIISGPLAAFATSYCKVRTKEELHCSVSYIHHIRATRSLCYFIVQGTGERGASLQRVLHTSYQGHSQPLLLHTARYGRKRSFTAARLTYIISGPLAAFATSYCKVRTKEELHCSVSYIHHIRATRSLCYFILQGTDERGASLQRVLHTSYLGHSQPLLLHTARYGRNRSFTAACLTYIISGPLAAFTTSYWFFLIARFFIGFAGSGCYGTAYIILTELSSMGRRAMFACIYNLSYPVGYVILAGIAYVFRDWRTLQLAISLPMVLLLLNCWFLPESPRWLMTKGRHPKAWAIVNNVDKSIEPPELHDTSSEQILGMALH